MTIKMGINTVSLLFMLLLVHDSSARCSMRGHCADLSTSFGMILPIPCAVDAEPEAVDTSQLSAQEISDFQSLCTAYANITNPDTKVCCTAGSVTGILTNFQTPMQFLSRCPSAMFNFASLFCALTCDPNQSSFMKVTNSTPSDPAIFEHGEQVISIELNMEAQFRDTLYASVAGVSATQAKAIDLLCLDSQCDPFKFLKQLGKRDPSAYNIEYNFTNESTANTIPIHGRQCYEAPTADEWPRNPVPCACTDCPSRCIPPIDFDDGSATREKRLYVFDMSLIGIAAFFTLLAVIFTGYAIRRKKLFGSMNVTSSTDELTPKESTSTANVTTEGDVLIKDGKSGRKSYITILIKFWCKNVVFRYPLLIICFGIAIVILMSCGLLTLKMVSDPVMLWSAPDSRARIEKNFFDENFEPFFRIETFIVSISDEDRDAFSFEKQIPDPATEGDTIPYTFSGIFRKEFLEEILSLQTAIRSISSLSDVCFKPMSTECMIQSPLNFFQSNATRLDMASADQDYANHIANCIKNPVLMKDAMYGDETIGCLSEWGGPPILDVVFGGFSGAVPIETGNNYYLSNTTSFVVTLLLKNSLNETKKANAEAFEHEFLQTLHEYKTRSVEINVTADETKTLHYNLSYYSERSVTDEIARQSSTDILTIALSYLAMFVYIAIALGNIASFIKAKVTLGFAGVAIVLTSVTSSIGFLSFVLRDGIVFNLIIIEVIPFLILAVGVDNIFLMVHSVERKDKSETRDEEELEDDVSEQLADIISTEAGPSILISSASEAGCFLIGCLVSGMPAVKAFAATAALSLIVLLFLQFTVFLSLLYLDTRRERRGVSPDLCLWPIFATWKLVRSPAQEEDAALQRRTQESEEGGGDRSDDRRISVITSTSQEQPSEPGCTWRSPCDFFVSKVIVPLVSYFHYFILFMWIINFIFCLHSVPRLKIGLDQEVSVPEDSYVKSFFMDQKEKMRVGPPLFFVLNTSSSSAFDFSLLKDQNLICASASCDQDSLGNVIKTNSLDQEKSLALNDTSSGKKYISGHAMSWLDEFLSGWLPSTDCCSIRIKSDGTAEYCEVRKPDCVPCVDKEDHLKSPDLFWLLLPKFLDTTPSISCPSGGKAAYSFTVNLGNDSVVASYFSTYHLPCKNSTDFINSIRSARLVSDQIQEKIVNVTGSEATKIFPYSIFYVFYEQYLSTWRETGIGLGSSLLAVVFIVTVSGVLKNWLNHVIFTMTLISFILHLMSCMQTSDIELNALSLVNLIMSIGISVEFTSHFMIAFAKCQSSDSTDGSSVISHVLQTTGSSILSGITLTKLIGISLLGFASSRIFLLYYFRFYLLLVAVGAVHGLVYLPSLCYVVATRN